MSQQRNEKCACGSGKKYKRCHYLIAYEEQERLYRETRDRAVRKSNETIVANNERRALRRGGGKGALAMLMAMATMGERR